MYRQKIAKKIHETAVEKGWWENKRDPDEIFMLIITELAEAIEADRKEAWVSVGDIEEYENRLYEGAVPIDQVFKVTIKDTVEDEIADAYIRCLDYLYHRYRDNIIYNSYEVSFKSDNFAVNVFQICRTIANRQIKDAVVELEALCIKSDIDLEWHVKAKMYYNSQREHRHGGKKY